MTTHYLKIILPLITLTGCNSDSKTSAEINPQATTEYTLLSSYSYNMSVLNSTNIHSKWSSLRIIKENPNEALYYPDVATDGKGVLISVWQSEYNPLYGGEYDVVFSASYDNGVTWSDTELVNPTDTTDSESDEDPQISTDGYGNWVIIWSSSEDINGSGNDSDIVFSHSEDNGKTWTTPKLINNYADDDSSRDWSPQISLKENRWVAVWSSSRSLDPIDNTDDMDILTSYSLDNGVTWSTPIYVNQTTISDDKTDYFNQFDMNDSGYGVVAWAGEHDSSDLDIYAAITHDFGESWSQPTLINNYALSETCMSNCNDYPTSVAVNNTGDSVIAWEGINPVTGSDNEAYISYSKNLGASWSNETYLNTNALTDGTRDNDDALKIHPISNTKWVAYWVATNGDNVIFRTSNDLIQWSDETIITTGVDEVVALAIH
ncbi:sialidase family protein [Aliivibrio fischeri]|uniref:sialidase family protein n=1 Tax=Aliivibrio fischeri TaxID=668 RepID=UPI000ABFA04D|nr:sialidase family protein [Aliivibrio fischeri]USR94337.1 glycoside hydrolase [Aliivibrio fischeri ATCC 7744 = JCM 18803 = DSM 507]GGK26111.1 hypothetical protein GCM10007987_07250 [Aliivibrio fischeri]